MLEEMIMKRSSIVSMAIVFVVCLLFTTVPVPSLAANPNVGYVDFSFGSAPGGAPTADKPQSKLWFNDGVWWAVMFKTGGNTYHIYRLNWPNQWVDTGVVVDDRPLAHADCLWDGTHLYVASTLSNVETSATNQGRLYRYSYVGGAYTLDTGFPAVMMTGSIESIAIDKDTIGKLWITFTLNSKVYVNRSTTDDATWGTPFVVPGATSATSLNPDDISSLVAYHDQNGASIGVLWSNHSTPSSMYFTHHKDGDPDTTWQPIEQIYTATCAADDHINLKSLQADSSGAIYAAVKTSFGDSGCGGNSSSPLIRLVVRKPNNSWAVTTFGTVGDDHTRPLVLLDTTNRKVYMFATSQTTCGNSIIYMKSTSMDTPDFSNQPGKGTPFISSSTYTCINNTTSTKQTVNANTGLVVMASDKNGRVYLHNAVAIGSPPPDTTPPTVGARSPSGGAVGVDPAANVTATFSEALDAATVGAASVSLSGPGAVSVPAAVSYDAASKTVTLNPSANLGFSTTYTVQLSGAITDLAGNPLAPVSWSFTTAAAPPDTTPPTVSAVSPINGTSEINLSADVTATFSEPMDSTTIAGSSFTLTVGQAAVVGIVSYDAATQTATLRPSRPLAANTTYTATISGVKDLAGNALVAPVTWSFSTAAAPAPGKRFIFLPFALS
jgi:hypothetical protein